MAALIHKGHGRVKKWQVIVVLYSLLAPIALSLSTQSIATFSLQPVNRYQCEPSPSAALEIATSPREFKILTLMPTGAQALATALCKHPVMKRHFDRVSITWRKRSLPTTEELLSGQFDLIWNRENVLKSRSIHLENLYTDIGQTPKYSVFWVTTRQDFTRSDAWFAERRIGLLSNTMSQSGYLLPVQDITEHGIKMATLTIAQYPNYLQLSEALISGSVDLIPSFDTSLADNIDQPLFFHAIQEDLPSGTWFMRTSLASQGAIVCAVADGLQSLQPHHFNLDTHSSAATSCQ